jgi:chemotaxis protein histidine kinase CheA
MPDDDARKKAGERLATDLRTQREESNLSADELRKKLHVPEGLFDAFESGRLTEHPMFNRVYLRSLTRSYADAAGVPSSVALSALDATLEGNYQEGQLAHQIEEYEKEKAEREAERKEAEREAREEEKERRKAEAVEEEDAPDEDTSDEAAATAAGAAATTAADEERDWTSQSPSGASGEEAERRQREKEEHARERDRKREERASKQQEEYDARRTGSTSTDSASSDRSTERQPAEGQPTEDQATEDQDTGRESGKQREDRPSRRQSGRHRRRERSGGNTGWWVLGGLALIGLAVAAFFLLRSPSDGGTQTTEASTTQTDTSAGGEQGAQDQSAPANLQLGETMHFTVVAEGGPLRDLKVTRDQDVRRPYWIEEGRAQVFPARERIVIENPAENEAQLDNVRLLAEGYPYPTDQRDDRGRIVITRQSMQSFADTLRGRPAQLSAQRDTASLVGP